MSEYLKDRATIHISIPEEATSEEAEQFFEWLGKIIDERSEGLWTTWDPSEYMHTQACEDSDHCYGPGSNVAKAYEDKIAALEQELRQRELHHFETEQENETLKSSVLRCDQCGAPPGECTNPDTGEWWGSCYKPLCGEETMITRHGLNYDYSVPRHCNEPHNHTGEHIYTPGT